MKAETSETLHPRASVFRQGSISIKSFHRILLALWRPISTTFVLQAVGGFVVRARYCQFQQLGSMHPHPSNLHLCSEGLVPGGRGPRPGAIGQDSGLRVLNRALTRPLGSKSGAWGKNWVQHRKTQSSCPLPTRTRTVPGRRSKPALTSPRKPGYRSIPIRDR